MRTIVFACCLFCLIGCAPTKSESKKDAGAVASFEGGSEERVKTFYPWSAVGSDEQLNEFLSKNDVQITRTHFHDRYLIVFYKKAEKTSK